MPSIAERTLKVALDLVFPPRCALCSRNGSLLCGPCIMDLPRAAGPRCERCFTPAASGMCRYCRTDPPSFIRTNAAFVMDTGARDLVHQLKYRGLTSLGEPMAALMASEGARPEADVIVPVPLHRGRQRSRGYNQSQYLARGLAAAWDLPVETRALRRIRPTVPLAKTMHRDERRAIVEGAFAGDAGRIAGRRLLLVDDVMTTGATLDACAAAAIEAGAASVRCLTFARAD